MAWAPRYATVTEFKSYLTIGDTQDDPELTLALESASRAIDRHTGRQFGVTASTEARTYAAQWDNTTACYVAEIDDVMTLVGLDVVVDGASLAATDYELRPFNAAERDRPWEYIYLDSATKSDLTSKRSVALTATYGWTSVPDTIKQACLMQAGQYFTGRHSLHGIVGSPDLGNELRIQAKLHPLVQTMIVNYRRLSAARLFA